MSYNKFDIAKIGALAVILCVIAYSALSKFAFVTSSMPVLRVEPDFTACQAIQTCASCVDKDKLINDCRGDIQAAFEDANIKCRGYLKNLITCKNSQTQRQSQCRVEVSNVEGCVGSVIAKTLQKWTDIGHGTA